MISRYNRNDNGNNNDDNNNDIHTAYFCFQLGSLWNDGRGGVALVLTGKPSVSRAIRRASPSVHVASQLFAKETRTANAHVL